jgi:ADP-glucose pyrophosphorylase
MDGVVVGDGCRLYDVGVEDTHIERAVIDQNAHISEGVTFRSHGGFCDLTFSARYDILFIVT